MKDSVIIVSGGMDSITLLHEKAEEIAFGIGLGWFMQEGGMMLVLGMVIGQYLCKTMRGVRNDGKMSVAHFTGVFNLNSDLRKEFYKLIDLNSNG